MKKEKLVQEVFFTPAFDRRDPNPSKNYGIGQVKCFMVLKGKKGATSFVFATGMLLDKTIKEYIQDGRAKYEITSFGYHFLNKPMGYDVGIHALKPMFEGEELSSEKCEWLGKPCFCDGSTMRADGYLKALIEEGSKAVWKKLEEDYYQYFK